MKVLLLAPANNPHTQSWANLLVKHGVNVHVASLHAPSEHDFDARVHLHLLSPKGPLGYVAAAIPLRRLIKRIKPTLLNAHYATGYGVLAALACPKSLPYMLSVWGTDVYEFPFKSALHRWLLNKNLARATRIASTSRAMLRHTQALRVAAGDHVPPILLTPFPVNTAVFSPFAHETENEAGDTAAPVLRIGTVKGLHHRYGVDRLLRVFAQALQRQLLSPDSELVIVGAGPGETTLKQLAVELGIDQQTQFLGRIAHAEVAPLLRTFDLYVALSRFESFGVALLEASACGIPVIASDADGPAEVIIDNKTGFICRSREQALDALHKLAINPQLRQQMGQAGRAHVVAHYSEAHCVEQMLAAYAATVESRLTRVVIVLSYPLSEPVIRNRFVPLLQVVSKQRRFDEVLLIAPPEQAGASVVLPEGVKHIKVPVRPVQGVNFVARAWREWVNAGRLYRQLFTVLNAKTAVNHVMVSVPSMFLLFLLPARTMTRKVKTLTLDIRDLTWEYLSPRGLIGGVKRIFQFQAKRKLRTADIVTTTNQEELRYAKQCRPKAVEASNIWMTNGISQSQFAQLKALVLPSVSETASTVRQIMYIGNIGHAEHLQTLLEVAKARPHWQFTLVGQGSSLTDLQALIARDALTNVHLPGRCDWSKVLEYYQQADVLFAQVHPSHQQQVPSKLYEYAATGRPVVFAGHGYALEVLQQFKQIHIAEPLSAPSIGDAIEAALDSWADNDACSQAREHNLAVLENHFIRERAIEAWLETLK